MASTLHKSEDRTLNPAGRIILIATILGALAAWLSLPSGYLSVPEFREFVGLAPATSTPPGALSSPEAVGTRTTALPIVQAKPDVRPVDESAQLPYVGGLWRSSSRFGHTYIFTQTGNSFEIYQDDRAGNPVRVGSGRIVKNGVTATLRTLKEKRWAMVSLNLSSDGKTLEGSFSGTAPQESNFSLRLSRVTNRAPEISGR